MNLGKSVAAVSSCFLHRQLFLTSKRSFKKIYPSGPNIAPKEYNIHDLSIRRKLNDDPETVLNILKMEPNELLSTSEQLRIGARGSLSITRVKTSNCAKGFWYNFETDEKGDMFELVKVAKKLSDEEMVVFAVKNILPFLKPASFESDESPEPKDYVVPSKESTEAYSKRILSELVPLEGSLAEEYLKYHRNIELISSKNLKFHPNLSCRSSFGGYLSHVPGLVSIASHPRSQDCNLQMTYLDPNTGQKHQHVAISKQTFGSFHDPLGFHSCEICENVGNKVTFVAEGVETALSVHQAFPEDHLIATLGKHNFTRIDPETLNQKVVLVFDNDGIDIGDDKVFNKAARRLAGAGKDVYIVFPPIIDGLDKTDMNDVLVHLGEEAVNKVVKENMKKVKL